MGKVSTRSCCVCRRRAAKRELYRLALEGGTVVWDREQRIQARGVYVHARVSCVSGLRDGIRAGGRGANQKNAPRTTHGVEGVVQRLLQEVTGTS